MGFTDRGYTAATPKIDTATTMSQPVTPTVPTITPNTSLRFTDKGYTAGTPRELTLGEEAQRAVGYPTEEPATHSTGFWNEAGRVVGYGAQELLRSVSELPKDIGITNKPLWETPTLSQAPSTTVGKVASSLVQFLVPFAGEEKLAATAVRFIPLAAKLAKIIKPTTMLGRAAIGAVKGSVATFVAFSPSDPNLSAYLQSLPDTQKIPVVNEITNLLATDASDSNAMNRFRNVLESMGMGALVSPILEGLGKGLVKVGQGTGEALKVIPGVPTAAKTIANAADWLNQKTADAFMGVGKLDEFRELAGFKTADTTTNLYQAARSFWNAGNFAAQSLKDGTFNFVKTAVGWETKRTGESLEDIVRRVQVIHPVAEQDFKDLLMYKRARQLEITSKDSPIPKATTATNLARLQALPYYRELEAEVQKYVELNSRHLDMLETTGKIDAATRARFEFTGSERTIYVPFFREQELQNIASGKPSVSLGSDLVHKPRDWYVGKSDAELQAELDAHPIADIFKNISTAFTTQSVDAIRNNILVRMFDGIKELDAAGVAQPFAELVPKTAHKITMSAGMLKKGLPGNAATIDAYGKDTFDFFTKKQDITDTSISFYDKGERQVWNIKDLLLLDSLRAMGPQHVSDALRIWTKFFSPLKNFSTKLITMNPAFFLIKNPIRDTMTSAIVSHSGLVPFWSLIKGLGKTYRNTDLYKDLELQGGGFGHGSAFNDASEKALTGKLIKYGFNPKTDNLLVSPHKFSTFMNKIEGIIKRTEMASRAEEYSRLINQGYSKEKAAYLAREVSVDFANRGSSAGFRAFSSTVPFLNASIQAWNMMLRSMGTKVLFGRTLTKTESNQARQVHKMMFDLAIIGGAFLPLIQYNSKDFFNDPGISKEYQAVPAFLKNTNFVIIIPNGDNTYSRWFIPKPFEFAVMTNLTEAALTQNYSMSDRSLILEYLKYTFSQTVMRGGISSNVPSIARPFYDIATNSKYTGGPVVPNGMENGTISQRQPFTSPTAIFIAEHLSGLPQWANMVKSPMKVEYIINSFLGGIGATIPYTLDIALREHMGLPAPTTEHGRPASVTSYSDVGGMLRNFGAGLANTVRQTGPLRLTKNEEDMYAAINRAKGAVADFNSVKQGLNGWTEKQRDEMLKDPDMKFWMQQNPMFTQAMNRIAGINKYIDFLSQNDPTNLKARDEQIRIRQDVVDNIMSIFHKNLENK